jgi:type IV pilus assembly protein PilX
VNPGRGRCRKDAQGAALIVVLCTLIVVLLLGASAAQMALQGEKAARGERDRHIAFQAAEAALMDAEIDIEGRLGAPGRSALFSSASALGFVDGCGSGGVELGLCLPAAQGKAPVWQTIDLADVDPDSGLGPGAWRFVPYGKFTGAVMQTGRGALPARAARYIIELLPSMEPGDDAAAAPHYLYRITAIGFGARDTTQVVLQSRYRKPGPQFGQGMP